ncbi:MAG: hypothetical protein AB1473_07945 [Thermodesulfobacteriota bacterium]
MKTRRIPKMAKLRVTVVLRVMLILWVISAFYVYGEPPRDYSFSFYAWSSCHSKDQEIPCSKNSLRDSFEAGRNVVLVRKEGICAARITGPCTYCDNYGLHKGSQFAVAEDCQQGFNVAIVGVDRTAVHVLSPQEDKSPLPKDVELEARRLLSTSLGRLDGPAKVLDEPPRALRVKHDILLLFVKYEVLKSGRIKDREDGAHQAPVLIMDNNVFPLPFTYGHIFFSVDGKLHLACTVAGPLAARTYRKLYDLSGETPRKVYDEHERMSAHGTEKSPARMTPQDRTTRGDAASELGLKILSGKRVIREKGQVCSWLTFRGHHT